MTSGLNLLLVEVRVCLYKINTFIYHLQSLSLCTFVCVCVCGSV